MKSALIIIDMQQGSFVPEARRHDPDGLVQRLNVLAARVRAAGGIVVFVQHDGPPGDPHHPDSPGWALVDGLRLEGSDLLVRKTSCDAFLDTALAGLLADNGIQQLIVTGCATDYCVDTTVRSALARRYDTVVPSDGHTTSDRPYLPALKIIEHHNAVWSDFIGPAGPARLCLCADVLLV
jgi:nicotinamidase-related amidase